jgi:hypothetical protein
LSSDDLQLKVEEMLPHLAIIFVKNFKEGVALFQTGLPSSFLGL